MTTPMPGESAQAFVRYISHPLGDSEGWAFCPDPANPSTVSTWTITRQGDGVMAGYSYLQGPATIHWYKSALPTRHKDIVPQHWCLSIILPSELAIRRLPRVVLQHIVAKLCPAYAVMLDDGKPCGLHVNCEGKFMPASAVSVANPLLWQWRMDAVAPDALRPAPPAPMPEIPFNLYL